MLFNIKILISVVSLLILFLVFVLFVYNIILKWGEHVLEPHVYRYKPHIFEMAYYI